MEHFELDFRESYNKKILKYLISILDEIL